MSTIYATLWCTCVCVCVRPPWNGHIPYADHLTVIVLSQLSTPCWFELFTCIGLKTTLMNDFKPFVYHHLCHSVVHVCMSTCHAFLGDRALVGGASVVLGLWKALCLALAVLEMPGSRCSCGCTVLDRLVHRLMTVGAPPMWSIHQWARSCLLFLGSGVLVALSIHPTRWRSWGILYIFTIFLLMGPTGWGWGTQVLLLIAPKVCLQAHPVLKNWSEGPDAEHRAALWYEQQRCLF